LSYFPANQIQWSYHHDSVSENCVVVFHPAKVKWFHHHCLVNSNYLVTFSETQT
jgi:uncharacterized protein YrrD